MPGTHDFDPEKLDLGKLIGRDRGQMQKIKLGIEQHAHSWELISYTPDNQVVGVAAFGPIQSLPIIMGLLTQLGAIPKSTVVPPAFRNGG